MSVFILDRSVIFSLNLVNIVTLQSKSSISLVWGVCAELGCLPVANGTVGCVAMKTVPLCAFRFV